MHFLSLIPPLTTIFLTFKTKKLIPALFAGVTVGAFISSSSFFSGILSIGEYIVDAISNKESLYTLGFLIVFGSIAELIEMAGGISGFSVKVERWIKNERSIYKWAWLLSIITFFDSSFHIIAVGTILKPLLEKVRGSREKLAFILSVTSLQLIELIPVATGFLGYMVTLLNNNLQGKGIKESAYIIFLKSIVWNFMPWVMLFICAGVTTANLGFGRYRLGSVREEKEFTQKHIERIKCLSTGEDEYPRKSMNLIVPIGILLASTIFFFWWTGKDNAHSFWGALSSAKYNISIFSAALLTLLATSIFYLFQKISLAEIESHIIGGGEKILSLVFVLILSWALTIVTRKLGFNTLINENLTSSIPKFLIPVFVFLISAVISYTVGSSWATWALIMPLAVTFSVDTGINISILAGTVWSGGAVSDVISPLAAQLADISFGDHLTTAFPYMATGVVITSAAYIILGIALY